MIWSNLVYLLSLSCEHAKLLQLCLTLCNTMDCRLPGSSVHGILQARTLEWEAILFSRGSSRPGIKPTSVLHWQAGSLLALFLESSFESLPGTEVP